MPTCIFGLGRVFRGFFGEAFIVQLRKLSLNVFFQFRLHLLLWQSPSLHAKALLPSVSNFGSATTAGRDSHERGVLAILAAAFRGNRA